MTMLALDEALHNCREASINERLACYAAVVREHTPKPSTA
jgi:hypothetical protein